MRAPALIAMAVLLAAPLATSAGSLPPQALVWGSAPSFDDMAAAWPAKGGDLIDGMATLSCQIGKSGAVTGCETLSEVPSGKGFARQAKGLIGKFRLKLDPTSLRKDQDYFVTVPFHFLNPAKPDGQARKVSNPRWISMPDPARIQAAFPKAAADTGVKKGVGVIDCATAADGHLTDCKVSREDPQGLGFGEAAMTVAPIMQMNPWTDDGRPVDGARIKLPIQFLLAGG